ncbi:hypothetical protein ACFFRR_006039 [Megaselia abdita]
MGRTLYTFAVFLALVTLAICGEETDTTNYYFTKLGEYKVLLKHENLTIDSRINMTDIETDVQLSYSALAILGKGCQKHRIECNDTIFELTVNLEEIENRLDIIYSMVDSNRIRPKKIPHPLLNDEWLEALNGHHEKCGDILAGKFTELENNITVGFSKAGEIIAAISDMQNKILHTLIFSPTNTVRTMKMHYYNKQFLYKPINLFNYHKIMKFVTFEMFPNPEVSTIFVKMVIPVFEPASEKMTLYEMNVPLKGEEFGYLVTSSESDDLLYAFKRNLSDCTMIRETRETIYACEDEAEFLKDGDDDFECISEAIKNNSLDLVCQFSYYLREKLFMCLTVLTLMLLTLVGMGVIMVVIRRRNREQRYEYLLKY